MSKNLVIKRVAVLGAGVMGAQIAAQCCNLNIPVYLFDLASNTSNNKNDITIKAIEHLKKIKPTPLGDNTVTQFITPLNYEDHAHYLADCDLVIEAIGEKLEWKISLYKTVVPHLAQHAVLASNTSGLSLTTLADQLPIERRARFCGIHFFNPPRYMDLVELIATDTTDSTLLDELETFITTYLGKSVVRAKDTPNFIANRVGVANMLFTLIEAKKYNLAIDIVDDITGKKIGRASSATYRTADVVGLDTLMHVVKTLQDYLPNDSFHRHYATPDLVEKLITKGAFGAKSGEGFYKKDGKAILKLDPNTMNYVASGDKANDTVQKILQLTWVERLHAAKHSDDPQAQFIWAIYRDIFHYCAIHLKDIADTARDIDFALRWGFGWKEGPFEIWQQAGWQTIAQLIKEDIDLGTALSNEPLPDWVFDGREGVHKENESWSAHQNRYVPYSQLPVYQRQYFPEKVSSNINKSIQLGTTVFETDELRAWTIDNNILIATLKTKMHTFNTGALESLDRAVTEAEDNFSGMVIWAPETPFSAGGDLKGFLDVFSSQGTDGLMREEKIFQRTMQHLRYSTIPTVAAVAGYALGGGCETFLHVDRRVVHFETNVGLVEVKVGLLPGAGGLTTLARLCGEKAQQLGNARESLPLLQQFYKQVMFSQVTNSAREAWQMGYCQSGDILVPNVKELLFVAIENAQAMANSCYRPPIKSTFPAMGKDGLAVLRQLIIQWQQAGLMSEHDAIIGEAVAQVMCGGEVDTGSAINEDWCLKLEREHFVSLMGYEKTRDRIKAILETGKPLKN
ncbi:3-hydroxyacyl-CoA dehydrogenase/enoyl-CoA hydratase family protein [Ferrovum sp. PN-J185]|uniref:3-hydroxyacyl-CoA dehydrogenase/enoyl-CoA hydratase family protein n=1 Tax=Ferrovum sp. PN-J185 TaxID=1356306 RepID=UPI00079A0967|nr:3-hydroxyacyl-CoA dehydrogenase/enoyl-CoA hydratase family protein [Ferrovum sp. PN-J185]KXW56769.1 putative 3-hydroxyacyl-CoA dehydrogenase [Ferrovum sp. PN-J185]